MALYGSATLVWQLSTDSTHAQKLSYRSLTKTEDVDLVESTSQFVNVADGVTDQAVSLGGLTTVKSLLIYSDRQISVKLNAQSITIGHTAAEDCWLCLPACSITAILVSNASSAEAEVYFSMAGA